MSLPPGERAKASIARRLLPILAFAFACALTAHPALAQGFDVKALMGMLAKVESSRADFVETKTLAALAAPLVLTGTLSYARPDRFERHVRTPVEERMTVAGDAITVESPSRKEKRSFSLRMNPVLWGFVESVRGTLAGDLRSLERFYWVRLDGDAGRWSLVLEPRDAAMSQYVQVIRVSGSGNKVDRVEVFEASGDRSDMRIKPS